MNFSNSAYKQFFLSSLGSPLMLSFKTTIIGGYFLRVAAYLCKLSEGTGRDLETYYNDCLKSTSIKNRCRKALNNENIFDMT